MIGSLTDGYLFQSAYELLKEYFMNGIIYTQDIMMYEYCSIRAHLPSMQPAQSHYDSSRQALYTAVSSEVNL